MLFHSEVLTGASGSVGGVTYSHNRSGMYRRARAIPVNPNTPNQVQVRSALTSLVTAWTETLTDAERAAWDLYGQNVPVINPLGASITLSGQNWYIGANAPRLQADEKLNPTPAIARVDNAPTIFDRGTFTTPTAAADGGGDVAISFTNTDAWADEVGSFMFIYQGRPQNTSINFFNGPWRLVALIAGAAVPPTSPLTITAQALTDNGYAPADGQKQWMTVSVSRVDGRYSTRRILTPFINAF